MSWQGVRTPSCLKGMCCADTNVGGYCQRETLKQLTAREKAAADNQTALTGLKAFSLAVALLSIHCVATTACLAAFSEVFFPAGQLPQFSSYGHFCSSQSAQFYCLSTFLIRSLLR